MRLNLRFSCASRNLVTRHTFETCSSFFSEKFINCYLVMAQLVSQSNWFDETIETASPKTVHLLHSCGIACVCSLCAFELCAVIIQLLIITGRSQQFTHLLFVCIQQRLDLGNSSSSRTSGDRTTTNRPRHDAPHTEFAEAAGCRSASHRRCGRAEEQK